MEDSKLLEVLFCKCETLVPLMSINKKMCPDCKTLYDFYLKDGQMSLLGSSRDNDKIVRSNKNATQ